MGLRDLLPSTDEKSEPTAADVADEVGSEIDFEEAQQSTIVETIDEKSEESGVESGAVVDELAEQHPEVDEKILGGIAQRVSERFREWIRDPDDTRKRAQLADLIEDLGEEGKVTDDRAEQMANQLAVGNNEKAVREMFADSEMRELLLREIGAGDLADVTFDDGDDGRSLRDVIGLADYKGELSEVSWDDHDVKQESMDEDNEDDENEEETEENSQLDMLKDEKRELLEEFAAEAGGDPEDYLDMLLSEGNSAEEDAGDVDEASFEDKDEKAETEDDDPNVVTESELDEKLEAHTEEVADAVVSDEVIDRIAGEVSQKMVNDEDFQDDLIETVDEKGDFGKTPTPNGEAPGDNKVAPGDIFGGDDE